MYRKLWFLWLNLSITIIVKQYFNEFNQKTYFEISSDSKFKRVIITFTLIVIDNFFF